MLDKQDLQAIRVLMKEEIHVLDTRITNIDKKIDGLDVKVASLDTRIDALDAKIDGLDVKIDRTEKNIIFAVGEMLEDNVFPQFEEVHRELRRMNTVIGWQQ